MSVPVNMAPQANRSPMKRSHTTESVVVPYSFLLQPKILTRANNRHSQPPPSHDSQRLPVRLGRRPLSTAAAPQARGGARIMPVRTVSSSSVAEQMTPLVTTYSGERSPNHLKRMQEESEPDPCYSQAAASQNATFLPPQSVSVANQTPFHFHRDSVSTTGSGSEESSPTVSFMDTTSVTETPATSPDTPASNHSLSSLALRSTGPVIRQDLRLVPLNEFARPSPPASKRAKNLKNLAVDTTASTSSLGRAVNTANLPFQPSQDQSILAPVLDTSRGLTSPRKRPNAMGLKIKTPAVDTFGLQAVGGPPPPTPAFQRPMALNLRHFQSSPSLPIASPIGGPIGGMRLPNHAPSKLATIGLPSHTTPEESDEEQQNFDLPQSMEEVPDAYPDGPICIYDPNIFLYLEPKLDVAQTFDVIFNVASEVKNPFCACTTSPCTCGKPPSAISLITPPPSEGSSDASSSSAENAAITRPEYIHVPWEHNTDIVPDLHHLVSIIDEKAKQGKRILIHCQCGVSRSASLIVAYGLYKKPGISVQEAYDAAKKRSKWIGPNMNLIMQLQEFRTSLLKVQGSHHASLKPRSKIFYSSPALSRLAYEPQSAVPGDSLAPQTAPLDLQWPRPKASSISLDGSDQLAQGPSSAPSGFPWPADKVEPRLISEEHGRSVSHSGPLGQPPINQTSNLADREEKSANADITPTGPSPPPAITEPTPVNSSERPPRLNFAAAAPVINTTSRSESLFSPRGQEFAMAPIKPPEVDDTFGLTSPRTTDFSVHLPHRFNSIEEAAEPKIGLVEPPRSLLSNEANSLERAKVKHSIGMSTRSHYDLRSGYLRAGGGTNSPPMPSLSVQARDDSSITPDALMSPRAFEFTKDPFSQAALNNSAAATEGKGISRSATPKAKEHDPRSPPQQETSPPIIRNIFDVL